MKFIGFLLFFSCAGLLVNAQVKLPQPLQLGKNDTIRTYVTEVDGELMPMYVGKEVIIRDVRIFKTQADHDNYRRLKYNIYKVLPYARYASERYAQLQRSLATTTDKRRQKRMVDTCENEIKGLFKKEIENLTISQGEILIKLIDRQTGNTSYEMVKDLKGGIKAFMFQSLARLFGHNLKESYNPGEEHDMEAILQEAGFYANQN